MVNMVYAFAISTAAAAAAVVVIIRSMDMMSKHGPSPLLFNSCVNLGESLNLTGPQLSPL